MDYDSDLDDDRFRAFDQNYNGIWDWLDPDMGGTPTPDDAVQTQFLATDFACDIDNDQIENENDTYPLSKNSKLGLQPVLLQQILTRVTRIQDV